MAKNVVRVGTYKAKSITVMNASTKNHGKSLDVAMARGIWVPMTHQNRPKSLYNLHNPIGG